MTDPLEKITLAQLEVLRAASSGTVSRLATDRGPWRLIPPAPEGARVRTRIGRAVTVPAEALIRKGYARPSTEPVDGRRSLVVTADGYELISEVSHNAR